MSSSASTQLQRQILSQPDELERVSVAGSVKAQVHAAAEALHRVRRIWVVGTGTSQHAALLGAVMLQDAGRSAHAVSSMQFVKNAPIVGPQDGVIVITHTGETAYTLSARALAVMGGLQTVTICREGLGVNDVIETVPKETSETYTVSYTATLLVLAMLASAMGADSITPDKIALVPGAARNAIEASGTEQIPIPARSLQVIGAGHAAVTAREGALKVREAARLLAEGYDVEFFLHGTAVPLGSQDHLVALGHGDDDGLVQAVAAAATVSGIGVTRLDEPSPLPSPLAQIPLAIRLQVLAARFAEARNHNPDTVIVGAWDDPALWSIGAPGR
ncbi:MAG TPA: SIS domain-containing protein [Actinomycetota bacterium]|nr:SIS domain-containing protein [Actinomycetota bacterium]